jgi:hypothetical protein
MWIISKDFILSIIFGLLVTTAFARSEGLYNPSSNAVGDYQGVDSNTSSVSVAFSLTYESSNSFATTGTATKDYGTQTYGSGNTRVVLVILWRGGGTVVSSASIGGSALSQVGAGAAFVCNSSGDCVDMWESTTALAGSSGDVSVTYSGIPNTRSAVALYNLVTTTPIVNTEGTQTNAFGTTCAITKTIPTGGAAVVALNTENALASNFTNATLDVSILSNTMIVGHTTTTGSLTVTSNASSNDVLGCSLAAWGP